MAGIFPRDMVGALIVQHQAFVQGLSSKALIWYRFGRRANGDRRATQHEAAHTRCDADTRHSAIFVIVYDKNGGPLLLLDPDDTALTAARLQGRRVLEVAANVWTRHL